MLTSKLGGSKAISKLLSLLSNASEIKALIEKLSEQEKKTKDAVSDLVKVETVDEYVKNRKWELSADEEAHQARVTLFELEESKLKDAQQKLDVDLNKFKEDKELFESTLEAATLKLDERSATIDSEFEKIADMQASAEHELEQATELRSKYEVKLKELEDSIAKLKA